jgi:Asp-tRNA(Asn)/Glu-tRNA(Gln) amidotransferase A subunit family amidase
MTLQLNQRGAFDLASALARREITALDLVNACLDRIDLREPEIHAWSALSPQSARERAKFLDAGPIRGLLHGLPLGVKDLFDTADLPTTYGSPIYAGHQPRVDAAAVALCRQAGAIVLGKTVSTEFATYQPGPTVNPRRAGHTPGGSSSGSAAAVADGMAPLALGSQTAGSIIRPAAFCGVTGYKPSFGKVPLAGMKPLSENLDTVGGFGLLVKDAALLLAALSGDHALLDIDENSTPRFGLCRTPQWGAADGDTQAAMEAAATGLSRHGADVVDVVIATQYSALAQLQADIMAHDAARSLSGEQERHADLLSAGLTSMLQAGMGINPQQHAANMALANAARRGADQWFVVCDVLIAPSAIGEAPAGLDSTGDPLLCRMWSLLGLPCIHVPFTSGSTGLPVGLQVIGRAGRDRQALHAAQWMQDRLAPQEGTTPR